MTKLVKAISFLIVLAIVGVIIYLSVDLAKQKGSVSPSASASPVPGATASPSASPSPAAAGPVVAPTEGKTGFGAGQIFGFSIATLLGLALLVVAGLFLVGAVGSKDRTMKGFREAGMANLTTKGNSFSTTLQSGVNGVRRKVALNKTLKRVSEVMEAMEEGPNKEEIKRMINEAKAGDEKAKKYVLDLEAQLNAQKAERKATVKPTDE